MVTDPATYEAWYHTPRGRWIGDIEFNLLLKLIRPVPGETLLDVGCGTGYFSRHFAQQGLSVTGIDPDYHAIDYAQRQTDNITYLTGSALNLPFPDRAFDHSVAITSLCFIEHPQKALSEMWRITQKNPDPWAAESSQHSSSPQKKPRELQRRQMGYGDRSLEPLDSFVVPLPKKYNSA